MGIAGDTITSDQGGSGYYLSNYTGSGFAGGEVWGTITPVSVLSGTEYAFSFYLANYNNINNAQIEPFINGSSVGAAVSASGVGVWEQFVFTWNSGAATTADLSLRNTVTNAGGNDFGIDTIAFVVPEPSTLMLVLAGATGLAGRRGRPSRRVGFASRRARRAIECQATPSFTTLGDEMRRPAP